MLKRSSAVIGLILLFVFVSFGQRSKAESELTSIYKRLDVALRARDANRVTQYYDANYTLESNGKTLSRAETIAQWKEILGFIKSVAKLTTKVDKILYKDGVYLVDYSQTSSGRIQFPQSPILPFTFEGKITDKWRRDKSGKWLNISSVEHVSDLKVNGESAKPPGN